MRTDLKTTSAATPRSKIFLMGIRIKSRRKLLVRAVFMCQKTIVEANAVTNVGRVSAEAWQWTEASFIQERDCKVVNITQPRAA